MIRVSATLLAFAAVGAGAQVNSPLSVASPIYSSSLLPAEPAAATASVPVNGGYAGAQAIEGTESGNRPFRSIGIAAKIGTGGIGFDVATPINRFLNLRSGAQFFGYTANIVADGLTANGDITLQNVHASVDYFPFHHGSFHISPGITIHNDNHIAGGLVVPGGQSFSLGDQDYTSDPSDPITGFARVRFGNTVAPRFVVGFGNIVPRGNHRLSFPVEVGFEYTAAPTISLTLSGSGCDAQGCAPINQGQNSQNIQAEVQDLQSDISGLRFFPIVSFGVGYKFGH